MNSLVAGVKIQSKKDSTVYEIVGIDLEQGKVILDNGKLYTMGTIQRWYSLYEEEIPEVVECQYTTGDFDLFIKIYAVNNHHLLNIIHDKLQPLGLARSETIIAFNSVINRQLPIDNIPVEEDED